MSVLPWLQVHLSDIAGVCSIASLALTFIVYLSLRRLLSQFLFSARVPEHISQLNEHARRLSELLHSFPETWEDIRERLATCEAVLASLKRKLRGEIRKPLANLLSTVSELRRSSKPRTEDPVRKVHCDLLCLLERLKNLQEDERLTRSS